ncbi:MAG: hypothetical protein A2700_01745 [Candidatus Blackburnbacteria bacterium RIFCSPHIGHO2_01_FULL_44_64]|uniref:DUF4258 domain-containing protein n=1 Tax=Candidatus Blackburnbacteria bacterium RIFCSPHIGHO2_02_FULL_44_20 TaxID=1797516 RepID=A0A1G1V7Z1_9BACT|nr:MAG: hypothetical protein A2700_01745 [Candidatus Blackburnbacteria bacterium RIFCSPHIGHO2_01_FULL_44_64]OGY11417.1 MAG: hypothetical protein A3D26_00010 [Candidatus Blackburnbacteria bacterium RIFCSPHIGHO2_02_FULL_44_20]OGY12230.1 MAG: hypothetical protein A3E16_02645 [Candidatus Blackburnbacteria bacterium RIFCSPHIGHO2_12_FULL_44_25]OGY13763.1 MAG: hypothetical protein A3A62_02690 [Candidatus Blackburnbacteria bacterium RIFCSPLOWO2_01_FULL_44_43]OGY15649.1 MAG: hypothetical protein A3H88_0
MDRNFGGIAWTNHALQRLKERGIKQGDAWATWRNPDQSRPGKGNLWIFYKRYGNEKIEVITNKDKDGRTVVVTVWSRPVYGPQRYKGANKTWDNILEKTLKFLFSWAKR